MFSSILKSVHKMGFYTHSHLFLPQSLGKAQTAAVKRDAEIGVAQVDDFLYLECSGVFF